MKTHLLDIKAEKKKEIDLPIVFGSKIRKDIVQKFVEATKYREMHSYSPFEMAGRRHSASGTISHRRHEWKGHYGKGISRVPRKTMYRRGTQFFWIAAEVSGTRGGRSVHAPTGIKRYRKINSKEIQIAINSAIASTADKNYVKSHYPNMKEFPNLPIVIDSVENQKTKNIVLFLKSLFKENFGNAIKIKSIRPGKLKRRGKRYKSNAGVLLIKGNNELFKMKGIDVKSTNDLLISDLYPLGRLTIYTEKALKELTQWK